MFVWSEYKKVRGIWSCKSPHGRAAPPPPSGSASDHLPSAIQFSASGPLSSYIPPLPQNCAMWRFMVRWMGIARVAPKAFTETCPNMPAMCPAQLADMGDNSTATWTNMTECEGCAGTGIFQWTVQGGTRHCGSQNRGGKASPSPHGRGEGGGTTECITNVGSRVPNQCWHDTQHRRFMYQIVFYCQYIRYTYMKYIGTYYT